MKTLYEKLSQENKQKFESNMELYPYSTVSSEKILNNNIYTLDLTLAESLSVWTILSNKPFDLNEFINLFEN